MLNDTTIYLYITIDRIVLHRKHSTSIERHTRFRVARFRSCFARHSDLLQTKECDKYRMDKAAPSANGHCLGHSINAGQIRYERNGRSQGFPKGISVQRQGFRKHFGCLRRLLYSLCGLGCQAAMREHPSKQSVLKINSFFAKTNKQLGTSQGTNAFPSNTLSRSECSYPTRCKRCVVYVETGVYLLVLKVIGERRNFH